jgi:hypothetical protein
MLSIPKGRHRSRISWQPFFKRKKIFTFVFDSSARYDVGKNQDALNKLVGFSDGCFNHHKNSFRLAWRYNKEKDCVEIHSYIYVDGERHTSFISDVPLFSSQSIEVECRKDIYRVVLNNFYVFYYNRFSRSVYSYKHMLWPYFGGQAVAPHRVSILINWK